MGLMGVDGGEGKKATGKAVHPWDPRPITEMDDFIAAPLHFIFHLLILMLGVC